mmetsp:Transcript_8705/g.21460  ORF Transcript_8705/g.21460 Transcript_8705/m.21460 type:complete len:92 (+) Transcript_8705:2-277(+)
MTDKWWKDRWTLEMREHHCHRPSYWLVQACITSIPLSESLKQEWGWMESVAKEEKHHPIIRRFALDKGEVIKEIDVLDKDTVNAPDSEKKF